jgi:acetyl-CoA carboxylase biotin carboxyl carrier protein
MNLELAEKIVALLSEYPVSEIAVEMQNCRIHAVKPLVPMPQTPQPAPPVPAPEQVGAGDKEKLEERAQEARVLTAPMVGIFYHAEPPLSFAAEVKAGQVIGSIESMKLMNDVAAEYGGRVIDILVEDGAPVDYGRPLFRLAAF